MPEQPAPPPGTIAYAELKRKQEQDKQATKRLTAAAGTEEKPKQGNKETRKLPSKQGKRLVSQETSQQTRKQAGRQGRKLPVQQTRKETSPLVSLQPAMPVKPDFYRKQTFELTEGDIKFLETAKFEMGDRYNARVAKNEIVRTGLELLRKDYEANKRTSFLVRKFAGAKGNK